MARPRTKITRKVHLPDGWIGVFFRNLYEADIIEIPGLGTFTTVNIKDRKTFHNFSGKTRVLAGYRRLKFTQSRRLKERLTKA